MQYAVVASIGKDFTIDPVPPSSPGIYLFLNAERRIMYVGLAHDLKAVLYRYQGLEGRKAMRERIAAGRATAVYWAECAHPASPPSLELLSIRRYEPPWNTHHNKTPRTEEEAVELDAEEERWLTSARDSLDQALEEATGVAGPTRSLVATGQARRRALRGTDTCRDAVLLAMGNLERRTRRTDFQLREIVAEVRSLTTRYPEVTIRTQVSSVMCANAPVHHVNHTNDLVRVARGRYRRATAEDDL